MRVDWYPCHRDGDMRTIYTCGALDFDLQGGLEARLDREIRAGARRIVISLKGSRFLHAGLLATLLSVQHRLQALGGVLMLAEAPWFMREMIRHMGLEDRFLWTKDIPTAENVLRLTGDRLPSLAGRSRLESFIG
ncbi:MAG TPA: anti-sigma factor antagonist [Bacteroidetes bacterium]|nr:anti-sigma factor antagonist [Bacteroidota bacterium]